MYSLLYHLFFLLKRKLMKNPDNKIYIRIIGYLEAYYNLYIVKQFRKHKSEKYGLTRKKRNQKVIISLTSFPKRIETVWITIETLLRQTVKADEIILWLAREQFPSLESLPTSLIEMQDRGLTIRFCKDLKSHKKYYYVMQEYPKDLIILADDDLFYPKETVETLLALHKDYPKDIICMTAQIIPSDFNSLPSVWRNPKPYERVTHSYYAQAYSGTGTLYPPYIMPEETFQKDLIAELCPFADDLWLKFMSLTNAVRTTAVYPFRCIPITIYGTDEDGLWYINGKDGQNDEQWRKLMEYYPEEFTRFKGLR